MFYVLSCADYQVEAPANTLSEAISLCRRLEAASGDSYARVVSHNGRIVADASGPLHDREYYRDAATQTGMYDAW